MRYTIKYFTVLAVIAFSVLTIFAQDTVQSISYDETVTGELIGDTYEQFYTFEGQAGDIITITMRSTADPDTRGLDSFLYLRDDNGAELALDDDSAGNLNSLIGPYELPYDGSYTVVATRFQQEFGSSEGGYELIVELAETIALSAGQPIDIDLSTISDVQFLDYTADEAGVYELSIELVAGQAGVDVYARTNSGDYLGGVGADPLNTSNFAVFALDEGEHAVLSTRSYQAYGPEGEIEFQGDVQARIILTRVDPTLLSVAVNEPVNITGELPGENAVDYYLFQASSGQEIAISGGTPNGGEIEIFIVVPQGYTSFYGSTLYNNGPDGLLPQQVLTADGDYILVVSQANLPPDAQEQTVTGTVNYDLSLSITSLEEVVSGQEVVGSIDFSNNEYEDVYVYNGQEGETLTITLGGTDANYAPGLSMELFPEDPEFDSAAPFYASFNASIARVPVTYTMTLPYSGDYVLRVYNTSQSSQPANSEYSLTIISGQ